MNSPATHRSTDTQVIVLTPAGRGAVATILVRGPRALELVGRRFEPLSRKPFTSNQPGSIVVGHYQSADHSSEELVVGIVAADRVEVHCHGGRAAIEAVVQSLIAEGATPGLWEEATFADPVDAIAAEALVALARATTERTAGILLDQYRGALRREIKLALASIERGQFEEARSIVARLLAAAPIGLHLTEPWRIAIAGRPNVGKSSLINALLGYQRAIVFDQPGTTRDVLTARTALDGWPVELADTAGLRESDDPLEAAGVQRAEQSLQRADVVLAVFEANEPWTITDEELLRATNAARRIVVFNKVDLGALPKDSRPAGIAVSAKTGENLERLISAVVERVSPQPIEPGQATPFTARQISALEQARDALSDGELAAAQDSLRSVIAVR